MPFYHSTTADKAIFWGARNRLGLNFGVLIAWSLINIASLSLFEWIMRRRAEKEHHEHQTKQASEKREGDIDAERGEGKKGVEDGGGEVEIRSSS